MIIDKCLLAIFEPRIFGRKARGRLAEFFDSVRKYVLSLYIHACFGLSFSTKLVPTVSGYLFIKDLHCYKIFLSKGWMREELERYRNILAAYPDITPLLGSVMPCRRPFLGVLKSPRYSPLVGTANFEAALELLQALRVFGIQKSIDLQSLPDLCAGMELVRRTCSKDVFFRVRKRVSAALQEEYFIGPCHGDFHERNIMLREDGRPVLIDYDCCSVQGVQAFDALYYLVQHLAFKESINWLEEASYLFQEKSTPKEFDLFRPYIDGDFQKLLLLFCLARLGQDMRFGDPLFTEKYLQFL